MRKSAQNALKQPRTAPTPLPAKSASCQRSFPACLQTKKTPDNAQAHSVPRHAPAPSGAFIPLQAVIEKPCSRFPALYFTERKERRTGNELRRSALTRHPIRRTNHAHANARRTMRDLTASLVMNRPARRVHSPSSRHRKNLPVPAIPRSISQNAKSAGQETNSGVPPSPVIPSGARITHTQMRAGQGAISQRPRHEPPYPARSFSYCAIIALPCGAFRASSAARR